MGLIYITGSPGAGKSTVQKRLRELGYEAYDIDDPGFGGPQNIKTGQTTTVPPIEKRTPEWFSAHVWKISRKAIEDLKAKASDHTIFLCGTASTDNEVWDLFDRVMYLDIDEKTLRSRIRSRENNDFGKTEHELQLIIERFKRDKHKYAQAGVITIDGRQPIDEVVREIIGKSNVS